jgi:hypothetical protein
MVTYEIIVRGMLDPSWSSWFEGMTVHSTGDDAAGSMTTLSGDLPDQSALRSVLNKLWDLNLDLISVRRREVREEA